jgi:hypothetical protein
MNNYSKHQNRLKEIMLHVQKELPSIRFYPRQVGRFFTYRLFEVLSQIRSLSDIGQAAIKIKKTCSIQISRPGMSDLYFTYPIQVYDETILLHGELEVKTGNAKLSKDQEIWKTHIVTRGGIFIEAREPEQTLDDIKNALRKIPRAFLKTQ